MSSWRFLLAWLVAWFGGRRGALGQRQRDQVDALKQDGEIEHAVNLAQAAAPADRAGVSRELRAGDF